MQAALISGISGSKTGANVQFHPIAAALGAAFRFTQPSQPAAIAHNLSPFAYFFFFEKLSNILQN
jgi:hypothetical protein